MRLAVRALIGNALTPEQVAAAAGRSLASNHASEDKVPTRLEDMSFRNYEALVGNGDNWVLIGPVFGGTRTWASGRLKEIGAIRNDLFHFRREMTTHDRQNLERLRGWLLNKVKQAGANRKLETDL